VSDQATAAESDSLAPSPLGAGRHVRSTLRKLNDHNRANLLADESDLVTAGVECRSPPADDSANRRFEVIIEDCEAGRVAWCAQDDPRRDGQVERRSWIRGAGVSPVNRRTSRVRFG